MKSMNDDQLETMATAASEALRSMAIVWKTAMLCVPIQSSEYRSICSAGNKTQSAYYNLMELAYNRGWSDERVRAVFTIDTAYGFS